MIFAVKKVRELEKLKGFRFSDANAKLTIYGVIDSTQLKHEVYKIVVTKKEVRISGGDAVGLMYGLLEIKDQLKAGKTSFVNKEESPNLAFRAIKFNLP